MERAVWLAAATWVGGVGAWGVGVGYALARGADNSQQQTTRPASPLSRGRPIRLDGGDDDAPTPPPEVVTIDSLPAPPLPLDAPVSEGASSRSASFDSSRTFDSLDEMEEFLLRQEAKLAAAAQSDADTDDEDGYVLGPESLGTPRAESVTQRAESSGFDLDLVPPDASALLTESQRRRLAPIKPLKRERRSRKIRITKPSEETFVPLVKGARATQDEAILNAYNDEGLKREQGEDYWVDPKQLENEIKAREASNKRRELYKAREKPFLEDRLKKEIAAPYKNNLISLIVVGVGVLGALFVAFPGLFELNEISSSRFPSEL